MGSVLGRVLTGSSKKSTFLMVGLDAVGKTTALYKLGVDVVTTFPTIGFTVETAEWKHFCFNVWDLNLGFCTQRQLCYPYTDTDGIIFVVDSNDRERMDDSHHCEYNVRDLLTKMLSEEELSGKPLLVFANKQDLAHALTVSQVSERLGLAHVRDRQWHIQAMTATTGDGLFEGLQWLSEQIRAV